MVTCRRGEREEIMWEKKPGRDEGEEEMKKAKAMQERAGR